MLKRDETLLGIDYGETNIGVAFGRAGLVEPLKIIPGKNLGEALKEISRAALEIKVNTVIIGLPLTAEGKETAQSLKTRYFANQLKLHLKKPIKFVNEYATSKEAIKNAIGQGISQKSRRKIDHISAALILKKYFEE
jgi:putative holliday junction resolvase